MDFGTLAGALVVGLSGGFLGTYASTRAARREGERQRAHEQRERLRERQIDAADDFLRAVTLVVTATADVESWFFLASDEHEGSRRDEGSQAAVDRFKALVQDATLHSQRLRLVIPEAVYDAAYGGLLAAGDMMSKLFYYAPPGGHIMAYGPEAQEEIDAIRGRLILASTAFQKAAVAVTQI